MKLSVLKIGVMSLVWLLQVGLSLTVLAEPIRTHHYQITINDALTEAKVKMCFDGKAPEYLVVDYRRANKNLIEFPHSLKGYIEFQGRYWLTQSLQADACVNYIADISEHNHQKYRSKESTPLSFQSDNTWLWLPEKLTATEAVEIEFKLADKYRVSAPWQMLDDKGHRFQIGHYPHDWGITIMIGDFQLVPVQLKQGGQINIALLKQIKQQSQLIEWVQFTAESLATYANGFPYPQVQVILIENNRFKKGPVPWGDVKRGGGPGIRFVVDSDKAIEAFYQDWTATHEFAHLLLPNIEYYDIWLSEGLASYLQYLLMAQSGIISHQQAWQKLFDGFERGRLGAESVKPESLLKTVENRKKGKTADRTKRIYWSGAAYFFMADIQLRQQTDGAMGLPELLQQLKACCLNATVEWSGEMLASELDRLSKTTIFSSLYEKIAQSKGFPDYLAQFNQLGIEIKQDRVHLIPHKNAKIRQAIMKENVPLISFPDN
ncbi:hypothetical protein [Aliikangiella maris]|uniref:Peptidase M61 catalytic domain-containing protein n=2 Tax=Aliikangiella maris TaxID=3162458 RepID=A0ABV2BYA0_9GAMM